MGLALVVLAITEWVVGDAVGGVMAAARGIVVITLLALVAEPAVRAGARVPDLLAALLAAAALALDQVAAAARYAPHLVGTTDGAPGLHLLAGLLGGAAAVVVGTRAAMADAAARTIGAVVVGLGISGILLAGGAVHGATVRPWYLALLLTQAVAGAAVVALTSRAPADAAGAPTPEETT